MFHDHHKSQPALGAWRRLAVLLAGCALPAAPSSAAVFEYLANRVNVTPGTSGSWVDVNVSANVPAGATGVLLEVDAGGNNHNWGCRKNGSSDTWMPSTENIDGDSHTFFMVGVDGSRILEIYQDSSGSTTWLLGYTTAGVTFLTTAADKSIAANNTWTDVNISADTGADTAIGAIFVVRNNSTSYRQFGLRKKGSTDNRFPDVHFSSAVMGIIGVDASEICQFRAEVGADLDLYLVGYVTSGAVFFTNGIDKSTATTGSYVDVDITANISSDANGALVEMVPTIDGTSGYFNAAFRPNGAAWDTYTQFTHALFPVGIDSGNRFEQKIADTSQDVWLIGYTLGDDPTISSAANQTLFVGDPTTEISQITITDSVGGKVTAANDLRVRIPAGFNMTWDTADTTATIGGTASGKVSTTVSYEDSNATLVLNVTSGFSAGEYVTVSNLGFKSFSGVSSTDNLELEAYNDNVVTCADDKTIQILVTPTPCGSPFCYLDTPANITPGTIDSWVDVDVSAYVPSGATGVILQAQGDGSSNRNFGVRKNGSSDTWMPSGNNLVSTQQHMYMIGVDSNRILEVYTAGTSVKTWLVGYTMNGVTFRTDALNKSLASIATPVDINISADTGAETAIGAIFIVKNISGTSYNYWLRMNGSSDNRYLNVLANTTLGAMIGVDGSEICEMQISNTSVDAYLVGYVTEGAVFFQNATSKATATVGNYVDVDITSDIGSDDANGAIVEWASTDNSTRNWALRREGATYDYYMGYRHLFGIVAIDSGDLFEQKISSTVMDLYLLGYTLAGASLAISSENNQAFGVGDPTTAISPITISEGGTPLINFIDDIRIRIPSGFNMTWATSDTAAVISGPASSKVSTTVAYEDSGRTLVINVSNSFAAADWIMVSGLSFAGFGAPSAKTNLEMDVDNDATADATDDKTIQIGPSGTTYYVRKTGSDSANGQSPATAWLTVDKAANTLVAGDWVYVGAGVYDERISPAGDGTAADSIRFIADTSGAWTGDAGAVHVTDSGGTQNVVELVGNDYYEFVGFRFSGGTDAVAWGGSVGGLMRDCEVDGAGDQGVFVSGASQLRIIGCNIHDQTMDGIWVQDNGVVTIIDTVFRSNGRDGVYLNNGTGSTVRVEGCVIESNGNDGVDVRENYDVVVVNCLIRDHPGANQGVVLDASATGSTVEVWNCTIVEAGDAIQVNAGTCTVRNSILANSTGDGIVLAGGAINHDFNLLWNNAGSDYVGTTAGANDVNSDPMFLGPVNFHLASSSPAIDAGTDGTSVTTLDFDGDARPTGAGWDMGYDERAQTAGPRILSWREVQPY